MPRIIALSGISGAGKTYTREHDPNLKNLPYIDIADVYESEPPGISSRIALALLLDRLESMLESGEDAVVVEACFRRGSKQRDWLEYVAEKHGATVEYVELDTPIQVCAQRVLAAWEEARSRPGITDEELARAERFYLARKTILEDIAAHGS